MRFDTLDVISRGLRFASYGFTWVKLLANILTRVDLLHSLQYAKAFQEHEIEIVEGFSMHSTDRVS